MSMRLILIKVSPPVLDQLIASKGGLLVALAADKLKGYSRRDDVEDSIDYGSISDEAEDAYSPIRTIIDAGVIFSPELQWAHTHPAWHSVERVKSLAKQLPALVSRKQALDRRVYPDTWQTHGNGEFGKIADFFTLAATQDKAVIVGVT